MCYRDLINVAFINSAEKVELLQPKHKLIAFDFKVFLKSHLVCFLMHEVVIDIIVK